MYFCLLWRFQWCFGCLEDIWKILGYFYHCLGFYYVAVENGLKCLSINYIKSGDAVTVFCHCSYNASHYSSIVQFWWGTLSFFIYFFFFYVLNSSYSTRRHCSYSSYRFFFLYFFFSFIYIVILTQKISQLLSCQFLISRNKIIKYETVTNHN